MRILFVNRIAWPDEGATAIYLTDVAEALAAEGHEVHVVCGEASYRGARVRAPASAHAGVRYHRVPGARGTGLWRRAWASLAFHARVARRLTRLPRPDVVVALTDPPFVDALALALARRRGARTIHWLMDLYPDVAVAAGVVRAEGLAHRALRAVMGRALRRADRVVVLGGAMRRPVLAAGVSRRRVRVIENWAPAAVEDAVAPPAPAEGPLVLMYSGNYGVPHDLAPWLAALGEVPADAPLRVVVQASGGGLEALRRGLAAVKVPVTWRAPAPGDRLAATLAEAHAHVVCVRPGFERLLVPSKCYAPLALGRPLVVVGPRACEPARLARRLGAGEVWSDLAQARAGLARLLARPRAALGVAPHRRRAAGLEAWRRVVGEVVEPAATGKATVSASAIASAQAKGAT